MLAGLPTTSTLTSRLGDGVERLALLDEDLGVLEQQVLALHARAARARADEQRDVGILERNLGVGRARHAGQQRKGAIVEFHHDALERRLRLVDRQLQQLQDTGWSAPSISPLAIRNSRL